TRALVRRCQIAHWQGRLDEALRIGEMAGAQAGAGVFAQIKLAAGQPADAVRELLEAGGGPDLTRLGVSLRPAWYDVLTEAELARGRLADADRWAGRARACADRLQLPGRHAYASLARARVQRAEGRHGEAATSASRAAESFASSGMRILEGQALAAAGGALLDAGRLNA